MKKRLFILLLLCVSFLPSCTKKAERPRQGELSVRFLDVGQGNSVLITSTEKTVLVDTGSESTQAVLLARLKELNVKKIDLLVLTHPDEDHIGGADGVLENFEVEKVWENGAVEQNDSFTRFHELLSAQRKSSQSVLAGDAFSLDCATLTVLYPKTCHELSEGNEGCLVLRLEIGSVSFLLMADTVENAEAELLTLYGTEQLGATVLGVGHHGSNTSSSQIFLNTVQPQYAVISCGAANRNGHPDGRALARLEAVQATILRTDLSGEIVFYTNGTECSLGQS